MSGTGWQPNVNAGVATRRAQMLQAVRDFFRQRNVLEVDTPVLAARTVTDPNIESITAATVDRPELYLQTSPEFFMKRLLATGYPDIYQVSKVFRDGERGRSHLAEFTMIEWYRLDFSLQEIMQDAIDLVSTVLAPGRLSADVSFISYADAFQSALSLDPCTADIDSLAGLAKADGNLRTALGEDRDAWLDLLLASKVVNEFAADGLTVLHHYPASQAALARICPGDRNLADRFELFCGNLELANGYVELTDADEQLARCERDQQSRREQGLPVPAIDENLIAALRAGLPPCAGVAVGLDRLFMINEGANDIGAINTFTLP
jgi:lysyl-tRNA synthetase class 2